MKRYTQRRPSVIRTLWVYRRLMLLAMALGVILWFIFVNGDAVNVHFPFGMGQITSSLGVVILGSMVVGAGVGILSVTVFMTLRRLRNGETNGNGNGNGNGHKEPSNGANPGIPAPKGAGKPDPFGDELPPNDYASRTKEGFTNSRWS